MSSLAASIAAPAVLTSRASASRRGRARLASRANDAGARRVARVNRATRAVASPSLPSTPLDSLPVPDFLRGPLSDIVRNVETALPDDAKKALLRTQYTSAVGLRLAFFLTQGVLSSRVSGRSNIDGAAAATAIAKAVLDPAPRAKIPDENSNLGNIVSNAADGRSLTDDEAAEVSQFLEQHLTCIVNLFRTELEHLETGTYKFPYDLNPSTAPAEQWNPADIFRIASDTLNDQAAVSDRRDKKAGQVRFFSSYDISVQTWAIRLT